MAYNELDRGHPGLAGILLANVGIFLGSRASSWVCGHPGQRGHLPGLAGILGLRASSWPTRASSWVCGHPGQRGHLPGLAGILGSRASSWVCGHPGQRGHLPGFAGILANAGIFI
ncbi:uncharacterized protein THITE_2121560 [Thermothielavioides terrestris NRRL 8126]|uniref:Uncharacterized protein n=1 Tax=Thermothielavioides terrestris (strain ATCC 38088 / NRRL 8126) TaxID=578455 RepID=G2RF24_THETT|nr:uncharacterized protein THITE_2121560 [Thermothielavioides terrestris NRRL 8126]AEO70307.1 hypothetical protein THITE_2121560 [Thermothielavioides terrestris NRRL 8126]